MPFVPDSATPPARRLTGGLALALATAIALLWSARPAMAQQQPPVSGPLLHIHEPFFVFPDFINLTVMGLHGYSFAAILVLVIVLTAGIHRKYAKERHKRRIKLLGVGRGQAFMLVDVLVHAVWRGRAIDEKRLERATQFARDLTEMDYTVDHLRAAALHADRLITPLSFSWMRRALGEADRRRIFETALAVVLENGPLTAGDRAFLRTVMRALGLESHQIGDLHLLVPA